MEPVLEVEERRRDCRVTRIWRAQRSQRGVLIGMRVEGRVERVEVAQSPDLALDEGLDARRAAVPRRLFDVLEAQVDDGIPAKVRLETAIIEAPNGGAGEQVATVFPGRFEETDLYAVAAIAFELMTGRRAYGGEAAEITSKKLDPKWDPVANIADLGLPEAVKVFLARGLAHDPLARFRSVEEFRAAMNRALDGLDGIGRDVDVSQLFDPDVTRAEGFVPSEGVAPKPREVKRKRVGWWLGGAAVVEKAEVVEKVEVVEKRPELPKGFVAVPAGRFAMGSPKDEAGRDEDEVLHEVELTRPLWVQTTEVSQRQWVKVMGSRPMRFAGCGERCAVEGVNWFEAVAYANALSEAEGLAKCYELEGCKGTLGGGCLDWSDGKCVGDYRCNVKFAGLQCEGYRLPTEAEWEYLARANSRTATPVGNLTLRAKRDAPELQAIAWYAGNSVAKFEGAFDCSEWDGRGKEAARCGPQEQAGKAKNAFGLYDMLGNVFEWVGDAYAPYEGREAVDPVVERGEGRVVRGGAWSSAARIVRSATRVALPPEERHDRVGFRVVRTAPL